MLIFLITKKDINCRAGGSEWHHRSSHCWCCSNTSPWCGQSDNVKWNQSGLCLHCCVSGFVDHSSAFQLSHHTFRDGVKQRKQAGEIKVQLNKAGIPIKKTKNVWLGTCRVIRYSVPGGSLPVTDTAYTPGLKLPKEREQTHFMNQKRGVSLRLSEGLF